ncbi:MAG: PilT protein domain protein [Caulobacteraceae bacterium]|nr:PilT protein domain protein [Caulobacteraceae bacterium]
MIAADTSVIISWMAQEDHPATRLLHQHWLQETLTLPPAVLSEAVSGPGLTDPEVWPLLNVRLIDLTEGYWGRAGRLRARILASGRKAKLGDSLIAQACIDADLPLLTKDGDFKIFAEIAGLKLAL